MSFFLPKQRHCIYSLYITVLFSCHTSSDNSLPYSVQNEQRVLKNIHNCLIEEEKIDSADIDNLWRNIKYDNLGYVTYADINLSPCYLREIPKFRHLRYLHLSYPDVQDISLLTPLNPRIFHAIRMTGDTLIIPETWVNLEYLMIEHSNIKQVIFPKNNTLREIYLEDTKITRLDSSMHYLQDLRLLSLLGTQVKDIYLPSLSKLRYVNMLATAANEEEIEAIRKKHSGILIDWY